MKRRQKYYLWLLLCVLFFIISTLAGGCGGGGGDATEGSIGPVPETPSVVGKLETVGDFKLKENEIADIVEMEYKDNVYQVDGIYLNKITAGLIGLNKAATAKNLLTSDTVALDGLSIGDVIIITPQKSDDVFYSFQLRITGKKRNTDLYEINVEPVSLKEIFTKFELKLVLDIDTRFNNNVMSMKSGIPVGAVKVNQIGATAQLLVDDLPEIKPNENGGMDIEFTRSEGGQTLTATVTNVTIDSTFNMEQSFAEVKADSIKFNYEAINTNWSEVYYLFEQTFMAGPVPVVLGLELNPYMSLAMSINCEFKNPYANVKAWIFEAPASGGKRLDFESSCGNPDLRVPNIQSNSNGQCGAKLDARIYVGVPKKFIGDMEKAIKKLFPNVWLVDLIAEKLADWLENVNAGLYATVANAVVSGWIEHGFSLESSPFLADIALKHRAGLFCADLTLDSPELVSLQYPLLFVIKPHKLSIETGQQATLSVYPEIKGLELGFYNWSVDNGLIVDIKEIGKLQNTLTFKAEREGTTNIRLYSPIYNAMCTVDVKTDSDIVISDDVNTSGDIVISEDVDVSDDVIISDDIIVSSDFVTSGDLVANNNHYEMVKIYTPSDLQNFRDRVNAGEVKLNVKLMNNINLGNLNWESIGFTGAVHFVDGYSYTGIFDGQGYEISGLKGSPLFYRIENSIIKNLKVTGEIDNFSGMSSGAGIVAVCLSSTVYNCTMNGSITDTIFGEVQKFGGICGEAYGSTIEACANNASLNGKIGSYGGVVALINKSKIKNCVNNGKIGKLSGDAGPVGGICSFIAPYEAAILNCINNSEVNAPDRICVGGILGTTRDYALYGSEVYVLNCKNFGTVIGKNKVGGIAGQIRSASKQIISCDNYGVITALHQQTLFDKTYFGDIYGYCNEIHDRHTGIRERY